MALRNDNRKRDAYVRAEDRAPAPRPVRRTETVLDLPPRVAAADTAPASREERAPLRSERLSRTTPVDLLQELRNVVRTLGPRTTNGSYVAIERMSPDELDALDQKIAPLFEDYLILEPKADNPDWGAWSKGCEIFTYVANAVSRRMGGDGEDEEREEPPRMDDADRQRHRPAPAEEEYTYCMVYLFHMQRAVAYLAPPFPVHTGDTVVVPFGAKDREVLGEVQDVFRCRAGEAPVPPESAKTVQRIATKEEVRSRMVAQRSTSSLTISHSSEEENAALRKKLRAYDSRYLWNSRDYSFSVKKDGQFLAGIEAERIFDTIEIRSLYVEEAVRNRGYGTRLLQHVEKLAAQNKVKRILLYNYSFQAPEFFIARGYEPFFEIDPCFGEYCQVYLVKVLDDSGPAALSEEYE